MKQPRVTCLGVLVFGSVLLASPGISRAQSYGATPRPPRFFVDVNLGGTDDALKDGPAFGSRFLHFGEIGTRSATYPRPSRGLSPLLDVGGGVWLTRSLGVSLGYSRTVFESAVGLDAKVPHPEFFDASASTSGVTTQPLERREAAWHLAVMLSLLRTDRLEVRAFGGPSRISYSAEMVREASFSQEFDTLTPQQSVAITGYASETAKDRTLGVNLGADVTYFLNERFGIGAGARFSQGIVTLADEPMSRLPQEIRVGGVLSFVGVRVRFGR